MAYKPQRLTVAEGGTGVATLALNGILFGNGTSAIQATSAAANSLLITNGSNVPALGTTLANSFACTASSSGGTISTTTSNTSNTASSNALSQVTVAGTSAGDAQSTYTVTGGSQWSLGTDNSDSDAFTISGGAVLGTNNVMRISGNGEINYPLQVAFLANHSGTQTDVTGDGTTVTVTWGTEIFDQNGDFASNTFTAPVTGRYFLAASIFPEGITASHTAGTFNFASSNRTYQFSGMSYGACRSATNYILTQASMLCDMDAADTCTITFGLANGTKVVDLNGTSTNSFFSGFLAC